MLRYAAPLHDIGKIGIPDAILNKPGTHTSEESEVMRRTRASAAAVAGRRRDRQLLQLAATSPRTTTRTGTAPAIRAA